MEVKERNIGSVPAEEMKEYPSWKDMTLKEKWEEVWFWGTGFIFADVILAGVHEDLPVFIDLPIVVGKLIEKIVVCLAQYI